MTNFGKVVLITVIGCVVMLTVTILGTYWSFNNREISLRNQAAAQEEVNKTIFDSVWKIISQKAQVREMYKDDFRKVYGDIMGARYGGERGGAAFSWIREHNPQFDSKLYLSLMDSIEGLRLRFQESQAKLRDIKREHDNVRTTFPGSVLVGGRPELKVAIVTSETAERAFDTKKENDVDLLKGKK